LKEERYLSHGQLWREFLTHQTPSTPLSQYLHHPSTPPHHPLMAYFNDNNSYYSTSSAPEELDLYPYLECQSSVTAREGYQQLARTFAGGSPTIDQPVSVGGPSTDLLAGTNYDEHLYTVPSPVNPYTPQQHGSYWPTISQPTHPRRSDALNLENSFQSRQGWEPAMPFLPIEPGKYHFEP